MSEKPLSFISIVKKSSRSKPRVSGGRLHAGILYKEQGATDYRFDGRTIRLEKGNLLYIPKHAVYDIHVASAEDGPFISMNFEGNVFGDDPKLFTNFNREYILERLNLLYTLQAKMESEPIVLKCQSVMYDILSALSEENISETQRIYMDRIQPSFDYIQEHLFDPELELQGIGSRSHISDTAFRQIFRKVTGMSPKKYVIEKRMEHARMMILAESVDRISDLALSLGFRDPLYFGKVFKSYFHISPKQYITRVSRRNYPKRGFFTKKQYI